MTKLSYFSKLFGLLLRKPSLIKPHMVFSSMVEIPFEEIKRAGFEYIVFDKDNTLSDHDHNEVKERFSEKLGQVIELFGIENVIIFTNNPKKLDFLIVNVPTQDVDKNNSKIENDSTQYQLKIIQSEAKKPFAFYDIDSYFSKNLNWESNSESQKEQKSSQTKIYSKEKIVYIGDRLLTDVFQARIQDGLGIYVEPWDWTHEQLIIKGGRFGENMLWRILGSKIESHKNKLIQDIQYKYNNKRIPNNNNNNINK